MQSDMMAKFVGAYRCLVSIPPVACAGNASSGFPRVNQTDSLAAPIIPLLTFLPSIALWALLQKCDFCQV